jgi:hypothetical protein
MTFELAVNLKTAQALGITIPNEILLQVTEVVKWGAGHSGRALARSDPISATGAPPLRSDPRYPSPVRVTLGPICRLLSQMGGRWIMS